MRATAFALLGTASLAACATMPNQYAVKSSAELAITQDAAWSKAIQYFALKNVPLSNLDKASGFILAEWTKPHYVCTGGFIGTCDQVPDRNADCGRDVFLIPQQYRTRVNVLLQPAPNGKATAQVTTDFSLVSRVTDLNTPVTSQCTSTGRLEADILNAIGASVPSQPQPMQPVN
jgi:hypothetical protein